MSQLIKFLGSLLVILFTSVIFAQKDFVAFDKIRANAITPSKKNTLVATDKKIYFVQNSDFLLLDSIDLVQVQDRVVSDVFFVHSNMVGVRFGTTNRYMPDLLNPRRQFFEYPQDSIFLYTIDNKQIDLRLPGNCYIAPSVGSKSLMGYNDYYEYKDNFQNTQLGSRKGEIVFFDGDKRLQAPANGIVIGQAIAPFDNQIALMYYFSDSIRIELRNTFDLAVATSRSFPGEGSSISYSDDGLFLIIWNQHPLSEELSFKVVKSSTLEEVVGSDIPNELVQGRLTNGSFWCLQNNSIVEKEIVSAKVKTEVWANLTEFADLKTFYKVGEEELIVVGNKRDLNGGYSAIWGIERVNLRDLKLYSDKTVFKSEIDTSLVFDNSKPFLQNNNIIDGQLQFDALGKWMLVHSNNNMQLWDVEKRLKIQDMFFDQSIKPYLSASGDEVLIFKNAAGKSGDDFYLEVLNVKTGQLRFKAYIDNSYSFLDHDSGKAIQVEGENSIWHYFNHYGCSIFEINTATLEIKQVREKEELGNIWVEVLNQEKIPESNKVLLHLRYGDIADAYDHVHSVLVKEKSGYYLFDPKDFSVTRVPNFDYSSIVSVVNTQHLLVTDTTAMKIQLYDFNHKLVKAIDIPRDINLNFFKWFTNAAGLHLATENKDSVLFYSFSSALDFQSRVLFKGHFSDIQVLPHSIICAEGLFEEKKWFTYFPEINQKVNWLSKQTEAKISHTISLNKNVLYVDNYQAIDLSALAVKDAEKRKSFNQWMPLKNQNALVRLSSEGGYDSPQYIFVEARDFDNFDSILWISNKIKYSDFLTPSILGISTDEKIGSIGPNTFLGDQLYFEIDFITHQFKKVGKEEISISRLQPDVIPIAMASQNVEYEGKSYYSREYLSMARFYQKKNLIIAIASKIYIWEKGNASPIKILPFSGFYADQFLIEKDRLYLITREGVIDIFDLNSFEKVLTIEVHGKDENAKVIAYTPDGYFKAPKEAIRNLHFVRDGNAFPLLNYELFLNRPDIVHTAAGFSDAKSISVFKEAYQKRLVRNGISDVKNVLSLAIPKVELSNSVSSVTSQSTVDLEMIFSKDAASFTIYDNGVPVASEQLDDQPTYKKQIVLNNGLNSISIVAKSKEGIESDPCFVQVNFIGKSEASKIYFVGVGVSTYKDSSWNLNFADDDVRSLAKFLQNENYFSSQRIIDTLNNALATKNNYLKLKERLAQSTVNDVVIVSLSGHGMLDENKNFYFGTYDIDFENPSKNGLSYDEIQSILDNVPARKKLLLIDACHSGEVNESNKQNWTASSNSPAKEGQKGGETENLGEVNTLDDESFEVMKNTFQDLDRGNGTFVISASGAKEYAIENGGNGVFTMSFINAIADWKWNDKGTLTITELQKEIYKRVSAATNGQQKPASRAENIEWDWVLE